MIRSAPTDPATVFAWSGARFAAVAPLFALDAQLGAIVRTTTQPIVGQMRLTWWHDALHALDAAPAPPHPLLAQIAALPAAAAPLAGMIDGWEVLLEAEAPDDAALALFAAARGGTLFAAAAALLGGEGEARRAGEAWALADLAAHVGDAGLAARAATLATGRLAARGRWRGGAAGLGALAADARAALAGRGAPGSPRRAAAVLRWRLAG
jgi:phytoene synthase